MDFVVGHVSSSDALGVLVAIALIVVLGAIAPKGTASPVRQPVIFLGLHLVAVLVRELVAPDEFAYRVARFLALLFLLGSIGRSAVLIVVEAILGRRMGRPLPKIIRDIVQGLVYLLCLLVALRSAGVEPTSLLTTSALVTAVIGLSLQETLGNLFAGLALQTERPFEVGDWIQYDNEPKHIGRVIEINWRATKVITLDDTLITVPNNVLAKTPIKTFTQPTVRARRSIFVSLRYESPPAAVHAAILEAARGVEGVLTDPPPTVVTNKFDESGIEYWLRFFTDRFDRRDIVDGMVRDRVWYGLERAGLSIPYPHRVVHLLQKSADASALEEADRLRARQAALASISLFSVLSEQDLQLLAESARERPYAAGEVIVRQGDPSGEMFIILEGSVKVALESGAQLATLEAGQFFGEMSLVVGAERTATVTAAKTCRLLAVGHEAVRKILERSPDVAERLSAALAARQAEIERFAAPSSTRTPLDDAARRGHFLSRIKKFFALG